MLTEGLRRSWDVGLGDSVGESVEVWDTDMLTEDDEEELLSEVASSASPPSEWNWYWSVLDARDSDIGRVVLVGWCRLLRTCWICRRCRLC